MTENNHMPLLAYEVAELNRPRKLLGEIIAVLVGAALAAIVVFGLGL